MTNQIFSNNRIELWMWIPYNYKALSKSFFLFPPLKVTGYVCVFTSLFLVTNDFIGILIHHDRFYLCMYIIFVFILTLHNSINTTHKLHYLCWSWYIINNNYYWVSNDFWKCCWRYSKNISKWQSNPVFQTITHQRISKP